MKDTMKAVTARAATRIELRAPDDVKELLNAAAAYTGVDLTSFVLSNIVPVAREIVERKDRLQVSIRDLQAVADMLTNPPAPPAALLKAAKELGKGHGIRTPDASDRKASRRPRIRVRPS